MFIHQKTGSIGGAYVTQWLMWLASDKNPNTTVVGSNPDAFLEC